MRVEVRAGRSPCRLSLGLDAFGPLSRASGAEQSDKDADEHTEWKKRACGMSREALGLARAAMLLASLWVVIPSVALADAVWEFVDGDGVVHMGNGSPPPASRGVTWLSRIPSI